MTETEQHAAEVISRLERMIESAPVVEIEATNTSPSHRKASFGANIPKLYRDPWVRPQDAKWESRLARVSAAMAEGGMYALIGTRGSGKTRLAIEAMRDTYPTDGRYTNAMNIFLRIRATYNKTATESEMDVITELKQAKMLIIDEAQERGEKEFADRMLTNIIDDRYMQCRATIIIANLTKEEFAQSMGVSIYDRLRERGRMIEMTGESFRAKQPTQ